jgi:hypothetical protein
MCTTPEFIAVSSAVLGLPLVVWSIYLQRKFYRTLQVAEPSLWAELGIKGFFKYNESPKEAAAGWYLLTGQYHYLSNDDLTSKGNHARWATFAGVGTLCIGLLATSLPTYTSVFACVQR